MKRSKNLLRKGAALAAMSTVLVSQAPLINAFAYGEADVSQSTFKQDTDNSADFQNWLSNVWQGGEKAYAQTENVALTPGSDAADLNFSWYSAGKGTPAVKVWKDGSKSSAKVVTGNAEAISAENWQGKSYSAANKVNIADYLKRTHSIITSIQTITQEMTVYGLLSMIIQLRQRISFQLFLPVTHRLVLQEAVQINQLMMPVLQEMHTTGTRQCSRH